MCLSKVVRMPDLTRLEIPEKQCHITLKDEIIFQDLRNQHRQLAVQEDPAVPGDYVLAQAVSAPDHARTVHIELGARRFPDYEKALLGCRTGQTLRAVICGEDTTLQVESVKQVVELPLTDQSIAALRIPGIHTLADYRRQYIADHGDTLADRIFSAIQEKLLNQLAEMMEVSLDQRELDRFHRQQREMIQNISGDVNQRLMDAYGGSTPEESDRLFFQDNRRTFLLYLWGKALADQDGHQMTQAELDQVLEYYQLIHEKSKEEVLAQGLMEEACQPFYLQYGIGALRRYFKSLVLISATDVPPQRVA